MTIENSKIKKEFDTFFSEWQKAIQAPDIQLSSRPQDYTENEPYRNIVKLGKDALPLVIDKLEQGMFLLNQAVFEITGKKEEDVFGKEKRIMSEQEKSKYIVEWWKSQKQ